MRKHGTGPRDAIVSANLNLIDSDAGLIEAALEIARDWDNALLRLCDAVLAHDYETAQNLARELKAKDNPGPAPKKKGQ